MLLVEVVVIEQPTFFSLQFRYSHFSSVVFVLITFSSLQTVLLALKSNVTQCPLLSMPSSFRGSIPCCWAIFCTSKPMCLRNWIAFISCPVSWSRIVGQEGLQWGHGQLSIKCRGQPRMGGVLCFWWLWFPWLLLTWRLSWRLRSQQWRALGREVPFTWMSIQWLQGQRDIWWWGGAKGRWQRIKSRYLLESETAVHSNICHNTKWSEY